MPLESNDNKKYLDEEGLAYVWSKIKPYLLPENLSFQVNTASNLLSYKTGSQANYSILASQSWVTNQGYTTNTGTVTSVRVQATAPIVSSVSTAQSGTLNTTISINPASTSAAGSMSAVDKVKLDKFALSSSVTSVDFGRAGSQTSTTAVSIFGNTTNKVALAITNSADNIEYMLAARDNRLLLTNLDTSTGVWSIYPAFFYKATKNSTAVSITAATVTKVPVSTVNASSSAAQTTDYFAISNGGIHVKAAGHYRIYGSVYMNSASGLTSRECRLYFGTDTTTMSNNTLVGQGRDAGSTTGAVQTTPNIIEVTGTSSYLFLAAYCTGATSSVSQSTSGTYLIIEKLD